VILRPLIHKLFQVHCKKFAITAILCQDPVTHTLEDLDAQVEINSTWETIRENITISAKEGLGYYELRKHKPWFDKGCLKLLDQRKKLNCSGYSIQAK
jgi:hypothetical protein